MHRAFSGQVFAVCCMVLLFAVFPGCKPSPPRVVVQAPSKVEDLPQALKQALERERSMTAGSATLRVSYSGSISSIMDATMSRETAGGTVLRYSWSGEAWRIEVRHANGELIRTLVYDGSRLSTGEAEYTKEQFFDAFAGTSHDSKLQSLLWPVSVPVGYLFPLSFKGLDMGNAVCGFEHYEVVEEPVPSGLVNHAALAIVPIYPLRYVGGNLLDPKEAAETAVNRLGDLALNKQRENSQCHLLVDCTRGLCVRKTTLTNEQTWSAPFEVRQGLWVCGEYEGRTWAGKGQREKGEKSSTEIRVALDPQEFSLEPQPENLFHIGEI